MIAKNNLIFFDRPFLEGIFYYRALNISDSRKYDHFVDQLRYHPTFFMAPPWEEIYIQDDERRHFFSEAVQEYELLKKSIPAHGYQMVGLSKVNVKERVQFIFSILKR